MPRNRPHSRKKVKADQSDDSREVSSQGNMPMIPGPGPLTLVKVDNHASFYTPEQMAAIQYVDPDFYDELKAEFLENSKHLRKMDTEAMSIAKSDSRSGRLWSFLALTISAAIVIGCFYLAYVHAIAGSYGTSLGLVTAISAIIAAIVLTRNRKAKK